MTIQAVRAQIRFALEQLKVQNKHHDFEHIAREFSRQRICRNLLPATGPVGGGGDQGRDFETFKSFLPRTLSIVGTPLFEGVAPDGNCFFACSVKKDIVPKIKSDIKSIASQAAELKPITYYCVEDVSVSARSKLIAWSKNDLGAELQIIDGKALSESLSDPDIFWIATEFLHVPANIYPAPRNEDTRYAEYKDWWIVDDIEPHNFSDFSQIKYGLRRATFNDKLKVDLPGWLKKMKAFTGEGSNTKLGRKARYEICVAALRGQNNLDAYKEVVEAYFSVMEEIFDPLELVDFTILLSYCSSAKAGGEFNIDAAYLNRLSKTLAKRIDHLLKKAENPNTRCILLELKARTELLQYRKGTEEPNVNVDGAFRIWMRLISSVGKAPLFPLEDFSDAVTALTPALGHDPRFGELTGKLDTLLSKRMGQACAAEKCRDRALALYRAGETVLAIEHLHRAKISWYSAETLRGTILTGCVLSQFYSELGLAHAAKYYAMSAFFLAFNSDKESVRDLISQSAFYAADCFYQAGEWLSFHSVMHVALMAHHQCDHEPLAIDEHEALQKVLFANVVIRTLAKRFWPEAVQLVDEAYSKWALDDATRAELEKLVHGKRDDGFWPSAPLETFWAQAEEQMCGRPFGDLGPVRTVTWKALGIEWSVNFANDYETTRVAEEFAAVLQIILVDVAQGDYQLLPTRVKINIFRSSSKGFKVSEKFGNERLEWDVHIPRYESGDEAAIDDWVGYVFAYAASALGYCTTLSRKQFHRRFEQAMKGGLPAKTFFVRPYAEIYGSVIASDMFFEKERLAAQRIEEARAFTFQERDQLKWKDAPGEKYSEKEAVAHAANRYRRLASLMSVVWPKILASPKWRVYFEHLHVQGYKDWHLAVIACNAIANFMTQDEARKVELTPERTAQLIATTNSIIDGGRDAEVSALDIEAIPFQALEMQDPTSFVSFMKTWGLDIHTPTPDFAAIRRFISQRYKIFEIDAPHKPLFAPESDPDLMLV